MAIFEGLIGSNRDTRRFWLPLSLSISRWTVHSGLSRRMRRRRRRNVGTRRWTRLHIARPLMAREQWESRNLLAGVRIVRITGGSFEMDA